jgi:hypothetical protein
MDDRRFDALTRSLAVPQTRRRALLVGAGAMALLGRARTGSAKGAKVVVCHLTGDPAQPIVAIEVSVNAIPAHAGHGDAIAPDFQTDSNHCGGCGNVCVAGDVCAAGACVEGACVPNGAMRCEGSGFVTCDNGSWVYRNCGPGTVCRPFQGSILCDWPQTG